MYKRILVATDGSKLSQKAVKSGIELATLADAELVAVKVVPRYPQSYFEGSVPLSIEEVGRIEKEWSEHGQAVVDAIKEAASAKGLKAKAVVVKSDLIAEAILAAAKKHKCDLIVMASHGRRGLKRLLLGSETQQVLTHSTIPVLVLR
ncbi:MAG: universal stress protein [Curvibacter sp.]|nr:universal stress protein [Curvibacter sp.]